MSVTINGSAGVTTNSGAVYNGIQTGTAVASTSGTSIDFTNIPSWVKRITVLYSGVSTNGSATYLIQIGTGSTPTTSGYVSTGSFNAALTSSTTGFVSNVNNPGYVYYGSATIQNITGNTWVCSGAGIISGTASCVTAGSVALAGVLNFVRITTTNGTDAFDAGSINIFYE